MSNVPPGDPLKGSSIVFGGKSYTIRFGLRAFRIAKKRINRPPLDIMKEVQEKQQMIEVDELCELFAAGLTGFESRMWSDAECEKLLEREPHKYLDLTIAVIGAVSEGLTRLMPKGGVGAVAQQTPTTTAQSQTQATDGQTSPALLDSPDALAGI